MQDPQRYLLPVLAALPRIEFRSGVEYGTVDGRPLRMHFARPRRRRGRLPVVLYLFGGGWRSGSPDQGALLIAALALRGYFAASIDYRLSHEAKFPAQLEDCRLAIHHLRRNSSYYGLDLNSVGVVGFSAGGHLAALLAATGDATDHATIEGAGATESRLQAVVTWSAPFDLVRIAEIQGTLNDPDTMTAGLLGGSISTRPDTAAQANPHTYLPTRTPPFFIAHGGSDSLVPPSEGISMHRALQANETDSTLLIVPGKGHGWLGLAALRQAFAFLDQHVKAAHP